MRRSVNVGAKSTVLVAELLQGDGPWVDIAAQWVQNPGKVTELLPPVSRDRGGDELVSETPR
jgi:hypothetical protein